jgi:hypothetical protein
MLHCFIKCIVYTKGIGRLIILRLVPMLSPWPRGVEQATLLSKNTRSTPEARRHGAQRHQSSSEATTALGCRWSKSTSKSWMRLTSQLTSAGTVGLCFLNRKPAHRSPRDGREDLADDHYVSIIDCYDFMTP